MEELATWRLELRLRWRAAPPSPGLLSAAGRVVA